MKKVNIYIFFQGIFQLNEIVILKGVNFIGFKFWLKDVMKEREWFDIFNINKINVRKYYMNKILFI